jgi:hypothetical protein
MKNRYSVLALCIAGLMVPTPAKSLPTTAQLKTAAKIGLVHEGFLLVKFFTSDDYLWNWQFAKGTSKTFPTSGLNNDVLNFLKTQRSDIIGIVTRDVKGGKKKANSNVRVTSSIVGMPRPSSFSDFTYAVGGCTVLSYADIYIGKPDSRGNITCTVTTWNSTLSDLYKFDKSDAFNVPGTKIPYFPAGELYDFERAGLAKQFTVASSWFTSTALLGTFVIPK